MLLKLLVKEVKFQIRSISFVISILIIGLLFNSEMKIEDKNMPLAPLDEMHYLYYILIDDYNDGEVNMMDTEVSLNSIILDKQDKELIRDAIIYMNPYWKEGVDNIENVVFAIDYNQFHQLMENLNTDIGGVTYYGSDLRGILYGNYSHNTFGYTTMTKSLEIMDVMDHMLQFMDSYGKVTQYSFLGIGKERTLSEADKLEIKKAKLSLINIKNNNFSEEDKIKSAWSVLYDLDTCLGGNTSFGNNKFNNGSILLREKTYEEAKLWFLESLDSKDKYTNAYARSIISWFGLFAGILPGLFAAFVLIKDKRHHMQELIYSRSCSSMKYIMFKFVAISSLFLLIFLILSTYYTIIFFRLGHLFHYNLDYFSFYKHTILWVLPTVIFSVAFSLFISMLFGSGLVAIVFQMVLFILSITSVEGDYRLFKLVINIGRMISYEEYIKISSQITANRIFICMISFVLLILTSKILDKRRTINNGWSKSIYRYLKIQPED